MDSIGKEFLEKTKEKYLGESGEEKELPRPPFELEYDKSKTLIVLPKPDDINLKDKNFRACVESRKSTRDFSKIPLRLTELSYLLWCTQGIKKVTKKNTLRTVPSAGARHPFETYLLLKNIDGIKPGLYRFIASKHALIEVNLEKDIAQKIKEACGNQDLFDPAAAVFIWAAIAERTIWRYNERGYRYILIDAGHVCQNLYLAAESLDCGACAVASFDDDELNHLLGLDGENGFAVYIGVVGKK